MSKLLQQYDFVIEELEATAQLSNEDNWRTKFCQKDHARIPKKSGLIWCTVSFMIWSLESVETKKKQQSSATKTTRL